MVTAAAPADDACIQGLGRHVQNLAAGQMMQLHRFAGGQLDQLDVQPLGGLHHKGQLVLGHAARGHPQADHALLAALFGIAAEAAGDAFVLLLAHIAGVKITGGFVKALKIRPEGGHHIVHMPLLCSAHRP